MMYYEDNFLSPFLLKYISVFLALLSTVVGNKLGLKLAKNPQFSEGKIKQA